MSGERDGLAALLPDVWITDQTRVPSQSGVGAWLTFDQATALADTLTQATEDAAMRERVEALYASTAALRYELQFFSVEELRRAIYGTGDGGERHG